MPVGPHVAQISVARNTNVRAWDKAGCNPEEPAVPALQKCDPLPTVQPTESPAAAPVTLAPTAAPPPTAAPAPTAAPSARRRLGDVGYGKTFDFHRANYLRKRRRERSALERRLDESTAAPTAATTKAPTAAAPDGGATGAPTPPKSVVDQCWASCSTFSEWGDVGGWPNTCDGEEGRCHCGGPISAVVNKGSPSEKIETYFNPQGRVQNALFTSMCFNEITDQGEARYTHKIEKCTCIDRKRSCSL